VTLGILDKLVVGQKRHGLCPLKPDNLLCPQLTAILKPARQALRITARPYVQG
jgi:hypothetical protein